MMRFSIRNQLAALVLIITLAALAVISIATWVTNHDLVLKQKDSYMLTIASLKAAQLSSNLDLMERIVRVMSTRPKLLAGFHRYNSGESLNDSWAGVTADLQSAMTGSGPQLLNLQTVLFPRDNPGSGLAHGVLNVTSPSITGLVSIPGTNATLGDTGAGFPPALYPNFTYSGSGNDSSIMFLGQELGVQSTLFFGPLIVNSSFSLFSLTVPVQDTTAPMDLLGWMTVVLDGSLVSDVVTSSTGLGKTGTTLLISPNTANNMLPSYVPSPLSGNGSDHLVDLKLRFVLPPDEQVYSPKRHGDYDYGEASTFPGSSYPAVLNGLEGFEDARNGSGSNLDTYNEEHKAVAVGYAIPATNLCNWLVVFETAKAEAYQLVDLLRTTLLACVFGTAGLAVLLIYPLAHFSSRPIRRLRDATKKVVGVQGPLDASDLPQDGEETIISEKSSDDTLTSTSKGQEKFRARSLSFAGMRPLNVPGRVKDGKHWVEDELTDLTQTFNTMSDELALQYGRLEERVRQRTAELELSKKAAEAANESKTLFIANISHELKTPLNGILGMTAVCMQEDDPSKIKRSLGIIYKSGDLLHHLLTDLLTFSRNTMAKELRLNEKEFRLRDVGAQLQAIFQTQASEGQITFSIIYQGLHDAAGSPVGLATGEYGPHNVGKVRDMVVWGDIQRLLQVAMNLTSNALKFTPKGGTVKFVIRCIEETSITSAGQRESFESMDGRVGELASSTVIQSREKSRMRQSLTSCTSGTTALEAHGDTRLAFEFAVEDTGPGIPEHLQTQIFEPFVQGDLRLTKKFGGTGLGLSICSQITKLMHGALSVESEVGVGSTFTLKIPLRLCQSRRDSNASELWQAELTPSIPAIIVACGEKPKTDSEEDVEKKEPRSLAATAAAAGPEKVVANAQGKLRVLVAEDNAVNAEIVTRMLKLEKILDVTIAKDGQIALDLVKKAKEHDGSEFNLILMDVQMPVMDGIASTRMIRKIGYSSPIVALTAFTDESNEKECLESGMDYFLAKPIKRPALKRVLQTYCTPDDVGDGGGQSAPS